MYDKAMEGMYLFGWSKSQVHRMFFTIESLHKPNNSQQKNIDFIQEPEGPEGNGTWCECYYDLGCPTWDCDSGAECDNSSGSPHDCGVFGGTACDGNCQ